MCSCVWNWRDWIMLISTTFVSCIVGLCHSVSSVRGSTAVHSSHHRFCVPSCCLMQVGMRVDLELEDGSKACGVFIHKKLSDSAGYISGC